MAHGCRPGIVGTRNRPSPLGPVGQMQKAHQRPKLRALQPIPVGVPLVGGRSMARQARPSNLKVYPDKHAQVGLNMGLPRYLSTSPKTQTKTHTSELVSFG